MSDPTRREFLKSTTAAVAAGAMMRGTTAASEAESKPPQAASSGSIPPHRELPIDGVHAYTDKLSVHAGESIRFHLSGTLPYEFQVCRLGTDVDSPREDEVLQSWRVNDPIMQPIHPGSYIEVEKGLSAENPIHAMTLECWIRLWNLPERQGVITQLDPKRPDGYGLLVEPDGSVVFFLGGGPKDVDATHRTVHSTGPGLLSKPGKKGDFTMPPAHWHHVVATFNGTHKAIFVDGRRVGRWKVGGGGRVATAPALPLRVGAFGRDGRADGFLDADISMPAIYGRALSPAEIQQRFDDKGLKTPALDGLLACWPLGEEKGARVADVSRHQRHGRIVNHATWMVGGPSFDANVGQFADYDPSKDPKRGHGLRLASDDLYDCRWNPTFEYRVPVDASSGVYVGRIRFQLGEEERISHALFIVKKAAGATKAPVAFLFSTNTWKAYSGTPFCPTWPGFLATVDNQGHAVDVNDARSPYSFYRVHRAGQPGYQIGMRMPWPVAGPYTTGYKVDVGFSHLCRADRFTEVWLEQEGYDYDALSDLDLDRDPHVLDGYKAVFVVGHSEYWSLPAYRNLDRHLESGGSLVNLSGNTMYWRVSFDEDASTVECRKADGFGAQIWPEYRGECWHSHDGQRGGPPRDCGFPAWKVLGVDFLSFNLVGIPGVGPFRVANPEHFLFQTPHRIDVDKGGLFGFDAKNPLRQAVGDESDVRVSTLMKHAAGPIPEGGAVGLTDPPGIDVLAEAMFDWSKRPHAGFFDYYHRRLPPEQMRQSDVGGEMIYWERPQGGRVFSASSIASGWILAVDERWSNLLKNVLHHFGVRARTG